MAGLWPRTGNVTVTNGSKIVTGFGTKWKTGTLPIQKGHTFYGPDNFAYEVDTVVSDESLTLVEAYRGGTLANQGYRIDITRTSTISQFAADLASLVAKYRAWFDGMMTWLTGSGDVAILNPDTGANVTIPSWKKVASEGEGQTARAKVEADRAKTEADRAFTEADRAAGIVAAAALPLPDVWAPLSDSLRLITGYGRDVLVGSDVVARMLNFSRNTAAAYVGKDGQWKNAAANEPRFEREGLLIEGQSTNVFNKASGTNFSWMSEGLTQSAGTAPLPFDVFQKTITSSTSNPTHIGRVLADIYSTPNPAASGGGPVTISAIMFGDADAIIAADPKLNIGSNLTITGVTNSAVKLTSGMVRVVWTGIITAGSAANFVNFQLSWLNRLPSVVAGCYQIEALPFASSYIPTNGTAVTRAADICWLNVAGNHFANGTHAFYASCKNCGVVSTTLTMRFIHVEGVSQHFSVRATGNDRRLGYLNNVDTTFASGVTSFEGIIAVAPGRLSKIGNFTAQSSPTFVTEDVSTKQLYIGSQGAGLHSIFGHVKNLRIWSKPLTNDQIKAVA
ncbi:TPA: hypothetical protein SD616_002532 [Aeromonas hydrophila]|nr:hypothetical protein [Aeromonas hydrophila]